MEIPESHSGRTGLTCGVRRSALRGADGPAPGRMQRAGWALAACGVALGVMGCERARPRTLEAVRKDLVRRFDAVRTFTADLKVSTDVRLPDGMTRTEVTDTLEYLRKDGKLYYHQEGRTTGLEIKNDGRSRKFDARHTTVADGEQVYTFGDAFGQPNIHKMKQSEEHETFGGGVLLARLERLYELELLPDEQLDGTAVYVISGTSQEGEKARGLDEQVKYYFGKDDGIVRRCDLLTRDGMSKIIMTLHNVRINVPLTADRFVFRPPPDIPVVDVDEVRRLMEEQQRLQQKVDHAAHAEDEHGHETRQEPDSGSAPAP